MHKTRLICCVIAICISSLIHAEEKMVQGTVKDGDRLPLPGVTVIVKGTRTGTVTDTDGVFSINVEKGDILQFSCIGYQTVEQRVTDRYQINIFLPVSAETLDEVVVVGYGVQKKASAVGSITQVKGESLMQTGGTATISQALQGMMPGVTVMANNSKPGADAPSIFIRGKTSWQSTTPLTLVDGVERDFNDVDPNEIESISVLKDASATAVYGVKGANGVILITTKRGTLSKPVINFSANFGFKDIITTPEYADYVTTMKMANEAMINDQAWDDLIPESTIAAWENAFATGNYGPYNEYFPQIDWWKEMTKTGYQQQYNINVRGGTPFMKYFMSLGYLYDGDIFNTGKNDMFDNSFYYRRYNWRTNFDFNITRTTVLSVSISGKQGHRNQAGYRLDDNVEDNSWQDKFFGRIFSAPRNSFPLKYEDGSYGVGPDGRNNLLIEFDKGQRMYKYYQQFVDVTLKQDLKMLLDGLSVSAKFSYNTESVTQSYIQRYKGSAFADTKYIAWYRAYDYSQPTGDGGYAVASEKRWIDSNFQGDSHDVNYDFMMQGGYSKHLYYEFALNYRQSFRNHNVTFLALMNRNEDEGLKPSSTSELKFKERDEAWVTRVTYNWKERYLLEFNGAYTGSQKFRRGKRFKFFPSYSVGWRISDEPWIKSWAGKFLNDLKVRYSYGIVGYDRSAAMFTYVQTYSNAGGGIDFGEFDITSYGPLYTEGQIANPEATWETAYKQDIGVDLRLFKGLTATLDLYKEFRKGILMNVALPAYVGAKEADGNIGQAKSRGFEVELGWNGSAGRDFRYWVKGSLAMNENRIVFRNDPANAPDYQKNAGKPISVVKRLIADGYYTSLDDIFNYATPINEETQRLLVPGDLIYADYNADGIIDTTNDQVPVDQPNYPQKTASLSFGFNWKGLSLSAMFYGGLGFYRDVTSSMLWDLGTARDGIYSANKDVTDRWTPATADTAKKPVLHYTQQARSYSMKGGTTFSYQNASYVRLKNLEISYSFSNRFFNSIGLDKCVLYANGNNLLTFTKFNKNTDPEHDSTSEYPMVRRYNIGIRLAF